MRRLFPLPAPATTPASSAASPSSAPPAPSTPPAPSAPPASSAAAPGGTEGAPPGANGSAGPDPATDREWTLDELADAYAYPAADDPVRSGRPGWLRANMVSSLDGAAHHEGRSHPLSGDADMRIFGVLRALSDAVVVGAETVRLEGYRPARARAAFAARRAAAGQGPAPAIAVVTAGLGLDFTLPLFTEPLVPTLVLTGAGAPEERVRAARAAGVEVLFAGEGTGVDPARVAEVLAAKGHTRLLTEGGPRLLGQFAAAGALDELCLSLAPVVTAGGAQRIMDGPAVAVPERFALVSVLEESGFLFTRYRRS
ncbi:pyrimidine reductase family protein [Streptomyces sp. NRRL F-4489]|uniref:pyrimidine reductase family protein n=1 Tax=Streptomyces sp. NRRL F-4489 TaxID=1609095 RepID=UPI000A63EB04|nr:pyrimidine reductase family protein [Streptomyces sp. NRRL F-4489]